MKGAFYVWAAFLMFMFLIVMVYAMFSPIMSVLIPSMQSQLNTSTPAGINASNTMNTITTVWTIWPFILLFGLLLWGFVASQRREPYEM